eukprot:s1242_g12.t1
MQKCHGNPYQEGGREDPVKAAARRENYARALEKAKEAVALSPSDPLNWETLGNAYVGNFFVNAKRPDEIKRALIAYEKGDAAYKKLGKRNPTLHFNRGMAAKYVEDYDLASRSLATAHEIGAAGAAEERRKVLALVDSLKEHLHKKSDKTKKLKDLSPAFPDNSAYSTIQTTGHIPGCKPLAQVLPLFRFFLSIAEFSKETSEDRMAEEEAAHEDAEHTTEEVKQDHGFRPACRAEGLPGIVPPAVQETHEGKHVEAQKALHPVEDPKAKLDKSKRTASGSSFAPSRGALYSFGSGVLLVALLMLGLWVLQLRQHHAVEELLMKQDKAHMREVRQLNQRLEEMSDQKSVFQRRARDLQARAVDSETLAAKLQMRTEELETQSKQQAVDSSTREKALHDLQGELKNAREEQNTTVAHFVEQLSRDTGMLAEAVEQDRENMEKSKAVLTLQARALTSQSKQVANGKREIRQLRHELEDSNSKQKRLRQESNSQQKALKEIWALRWIVFYNTCLWQLLLVEQLVKASLMQKTIVDSSASWKHKLQALENQKEALRRDLDGQRETMRIFSTTAKEKLESAELEAKKHAGEAVGKLEAQLAQQENLVESLLQQLQHRTQERDAGKLRLAQLRKRMQEQEVKTLEVQHDAISQRLERFPDLDDEEEGLLPGEPEVPAHLRGQAGFHGQRRHLLRLED